MAAVVAAALAAPVGAEQRAGENLQSDSARLTTDGAGAAAPLVRAGRSSFSGQHGATAQHLPAVQQNMQSVSKLEMKGPFGGTIEGQIADVGVFRNTAYLASWNATGEGEPYCRGGVFSVDISNPAQPRELAFRAALPGSYHGEGVHAIAVKTAQFSGDVLAVNNEICDEAQAAADGGFDLYDVSNPADPKLLVRAAGDRSEGAAAGVADLDRANQFHSVFMWQFGGKAYLVGVDNAESAGSDVDIFDISDPRAPKHIADLDLDARFPQIVDRGAYGDAVFLHDMVVKEISGRPVMLLSYWDAGYVQVDVTDPTAPKYIADSMYDARDPQVGFPPDIEDQRPEGNGHQAEFSHDNRFILAADEDFGTYRFRSFVVEGLGERPAGEFGFSKPIAQLPDAVLNGPTRFGGYGCDATENDANAGNDIEPAATLVADANEEKILVVERGPTGDPDAPYDACRFDEKMQNAIDKGYTGIIIGQRHLAGGAASDSFFCGGGNPRNIAGVCTTHAAMHEIFNDAPNYTYPEAEPALNEEGRDIVGTTVFDGWGYTHLHDATQPKMPRIDSFAIEEAVDERYAFGFGDLSVHEFATDPTEYIAYAAYYSGGMRTFMFGPNGLDQAGVFIDQGGSNFWGVEQFTAADGQRYIAGADRDEGLYILRYTGPGAAAPPKCEDLFVATNGEPITIPLRCSDPNNNPLTLSIAKAPLNGTLGPIDQASDRVVYTPRAGFNGRDTFTYAAFDGAANSPLAQVQILVGRCANPVNGTPANDLLNGTPFGDTLKGGAGNDTMLGAQGDDCMFGEAGNDQLTGAEGADLLSGGLGGDRLFGDAGTDVLEGGSGVDHLRGGSGNDRLRGNSGRDFLSGGSNNDTLDGGSGPDSLRGDAGNDRITGGSGNDSIDAGKGANRVSAGAGRDRIEAVNGRRDRISCGTGRDRVRADRVDRVSRNCERVLRTRRSR